MSNRLRHYRRFMIRSAVEAKGRKLFYRGHGRAVADDPSRLSAALHKARGTDPALLHKPKRGTDAKKPTHTTMEKKKPGLSTALRDAILARRRAQ